MIEPDFPWWEPNSPNYICDDESFVKTFNLHEGLTRPVIEEIEYYDFEVKNKKKKDR